MGLLEQFKLSRRVLRSLARDECWRVVVMGDKWLCPFCGGVGADDLRMDDPVDRKIVRHLQEGCERWKGGSGTQRAYADLKIIADNMQRKAVIADKVRFNPLWRCMDLDGFWYCPYCASNTEILLPSPDEVDAGNVDDVFRHVQQCPAALQSRDNYRPEEVLRRAVEGANERIKMRRVEIVQEWESNLREARRRQMQMLPKLPKLKGLEVHAVYKPCLSVSGDFYDFLQVGREKIGIAVGDVSGHGMEAALVMGVAKKLLTIHGKGKAGPAQVLKLTNSDIYPDLGKISFVSIWYGVLDTETLQLRFARAGHNPLIVYNEQREPRLQTFNPGGMIVGVDRGPGFNASLQESELELMPGDTLVQYTDGVVETQNRHREEFGMQRFCDLIATCDGVSLEELGRRVETALEDFREGGEQDDDITILAMRVTESRRWTRALEERRRGVESERRRVIFPPRGAPDNGAGG